MGRLFNLQGTSSVTVTDFGFWSMPVTDKCGMSDSVAYVIDYGTGNTIQRRVTETMTISNSVINSVKYNDVIYTDSGKEDSSIGQTCDVLPPGRSFASCYDGYTLATEANRSVGDTLIANDVLTVRVEKIKVIPTCGRILPNNYCTLSTVDRTKKITLPPPELGNTETINTGTVPRRDVTCSTKLVRRKNRIYVVEHELVFVVRGIKDVIKFLCDTAGQTVILTLHTGDSITGVIETDPISIMDLYNTYSEQYTITLKIRGLYNGL